MKKATRFVGLDVHAESIAVAVAEGGRNGEVRSLGTIPNRRYQALVAKGKPHCKVITAIGRELLGFIWAIATRVERDHAASHPKTLAA